MRRRRTGPTLRLDQAKLLGALADSKPEISVVVATHNRRCRLEALISAVRAQTLARERFELIVVDDGSDDETAELLAAEAAGAGLRLRTITRESSAGPATARDEGWRIAGAPLVAFTDDDCEPSPEWLATGLERAIAAPGAIIQGRTEPLPSERGRIGPFSRTIRVTAPDPAYQTCNMIYPREVLERIGGFDVAAFDRAPGGEDADLAWRAIKAGAEAQFASELLVYHAVNQLGPLGKLRVAARWTTPMLAYVRHPELRHAHFVKRLFWKGSHYLLMRALLALALPRGLRWLAPWLVYPYLHELRVRTTAAGAGRLLMPYFALHDLIEVWTVGRAAIRYRTPML